MLQITLPALHQDKTVLWDKLFYQSRWQLNRFRPWYNVEFKGQNLPDSLNANRTEAATRKIIADKKYAGGVRVSFLPGATYANLVKVLDIMNYTDQKKYWLDIHHQPITLYAITEKSLATRPVECPLCDDAITRSPPPVIHTFQQLLAEFWQRIQSLRERVWRQPLLLLLIMSGLSLWQLLYKELSRFNF